MKFAELPPWEILLVAALAPFWAALAKNAADDTYKAMEQFVSGVWAARRQVDEQAGHLGRRGSLQLGDRQSEVVLELEEDLPLDAYRALHQLAWKALQPGVSRYDPENGQWRDPARAWGQLPAGEVNEAFRAAAMSYMGYPAELEQAAHAVIAVTAWTTSLAQQFVRDSWRDFERLAEIRKG